MLLADIVDCIQSLTIFAKHSILGASQGKCASDKTKQKLSVLPFISQNIRTASSADFFHSWNQLYPHIIILRWDINRKFHTRFFWFQIDSPMQLNIDIKQPPITCSNSSQQFLTLSNFFDGCKEIQSKLRSILRKTISSLQF